MLGRGFMKVGEEKLPTPTAGPKIRYRNIENVLTSEAGTDQADVIRLKKRTVSCTFQVTSFWRDKLLDIAGESTVQLQIGSDTAFVVRPRIQNDDMFDGSYNVAGTDGLYTVNINFEEV